MRVSLNWLKEYVDIDVPAEELACRMTMLGLEIEAVERTGDAIREVYIGKILSIDPHPDADKIVVCKTDVGGEAPLQICCGARNMKVGDKVPTAVVGAVLPGGFEISRRKMRGVESQGMMCSAKELGLGEDIDGLMILPEDTPVGADARQVLGLDDVIFEIEVTPNRGDWASMIGVARELAALFRKQVRIPKVEFVESGPAASQLSSVTVEDAELCPRYLGRVLTSLRVGPSPKWLTQRLLAAGQRPINNIVDITNYVLLETGHPLHAFDYDKLIENRIVVRRATEDEVIRTLDGQERPLRPEMLVIADAREAQCVAGVMGGATSEVGETTTRVFLESAYFNPVSIRRTSRALGLITESSQRFQRGADPEMARFAIDRAAALMQDIAGAVVAPGVLDAYPQPLEQKEVKLRYSRTHALLGAEVSPDDQRNILERLGFVCAARDADSCTLRVPTWRHDVTHGEADLIEEIARLHGYEKVPTTLPRVRQNEQVFAPQEGRVRQLRHFLVGQGLSELYNWTFSCPQDLARARLDGAGAEMVLLENPLSEKHAGMRTTLVPGLLQAAAYNVNRGLSDIAVFEIGPVYRLAGVEALPTQELRLGVLLSGVPEAPHWGQQPRSADFYDIKGYAEAVLDFFGAEVAFDPVARDTFQAGQCACIRPVGKEIGTAGKIAKTVAKDFDVEADLFVLELDLESLLSLPVLRPQFQPVPAFPPSLRDLAVLVDRVTPAGALLAAVENAGGKLLHQAEIFDVYAGERIPSGKKSVAINLIFQSPERTLTDKDTEKSLQKIMKQLETQFGAQRR